MKRIVLFIFLLLFGKIIFSQSSRLGLKHNVTFIPQGFTLSLLNGYGNSALFNDVSNISSMNPAALEIFNDKILGLSYQFESKLKDSWIADIGSERINKTIPQSIGFIYPFKNIKFGFSMYQKYNRSLLFGPIEITTIEHPAGTGETFNVEYKTMIYNYSFITSYSSRDLIPNSTLSIGFRIGLNNLREYNKIYKADLDESLYTSEFAFGAVYSSNKDANQHLKFGLFFESGSNFNKIAKYNMQDTLITNNGGRDNYYTIDNGFRIVAKSPLVLRFDFDISTIDNFKLLGSISDIFWSSISDNYKNQIELSGSILYLFDELLTPSIGFIYTDRKYLEDYFGMNQSLDAIFLIASTVTKYSNMKIHFTLADSHLFSGDWRKQTIFRFTMSYSF